MRAYDVILKKREGGTLSPEEISYFIQGYVGGAIPDYQAAALLMAIFLKGMETKELAQWTNAMIDSGERLHFDHSKGPYLDKHSTGGIGDKISLPLAPIVAALGVKVPMISGRGLGHTGGTLDKLEAIPGYRVNLSTAEFRHVVETVGCSITGQTGTLVPADKKLYALRDVTATVDNIPLIASSILSKKAASGISGLVMDVKCGSGAFMQTPKAAGDLARVLVSLGGALGMRVQAFVTNMDQPLGTHVGNALEIVETIDILKGGGPADSVAITREFAAAMLVLGGLCPDRAAALPKVDQAIASGAALRKFADMVQAHGGNPAIVDNPGLLPAAKKHQVYVASRDGYLQATDTRKVGLAALVLGAGRDRSEDSIDPAVGFVVRAKTGDRLTKGQPILDIHYNDEARLPGCIKLLDEAMPLGDTPVKPWDLILDTIS
jgi:pyrimidine-nucleoside phosphorylase